MARRQDVAEEERALRSDVGRHRAERRIRHRNAYEVGLTSVKAAPFSTHPNRRPAGQRAVSPRAQ
jgi:hypothetical protein